MFGFVWKAFFAGLTILSSFTSVNCEFVELYFNEQSRM